MEIFSALRKSATDFVKKHFWYTFLALILLAGFLVLGNAIVILALIVLTVISKIVEVFLPRAADFDLSLFTLVVLQQAYGFSLAFVITLISFFIGLAFKGKLQHRIAGENLIFPPIGFLVAGLLISFLNFDLFTTGMIAVLAYASLMVLLYGILYHFPIFEIVIYLATIFPFNYFIFLNFANPVLQFLIT